MLHPSNAKAVNYFCLLFSNIPWQVNLLLCAELCRELCGVHRCNNSKPSLLASSFSSLFQSGLISSGKPLYCGSVMPAWHDCVGLWAGIAWGFRCSACVPPRSTTMRGLPPANGPCCIAPQRSLSRDPNYSFTSPPHPLRLQTAASKAFQMYSGVIIQRSYTSTLSFWPLLHVFCFLQIQLLRCIAVSLYRSLSPHFEHCFMFSSFSDVQLCSKVYIPQA